MFSGGASAWRYLQAHDPEYGKSYIVIGALTDKKEASAISYFEQAHIPCIVFDYKEWTVIANITDKTERRIAYFEAVKEKAAEHKPDLIMLSGFMKLVPSNFYTSFFMINVHPADLRITKDGERKYIGDNAVTFALEAGEKETCSTVHEINGETDGGPIICVSDPLLVEEGDTPKEHQEKMKSACDGPAVQKAIGLIVSKKYQKQVF